MKEISVFPKLYRRRDGKMYTWKIWVEGDIIFWKTGTDQGKKQLFSKKGECKNKGKKNEKTPEENAISEAQSKWEKMKRTKGYKEKNIDDAQDDPEHGKNDEEYKLEEVENQFPILVMNSESIIKMTEKKTKNKKTGKSEEWNWNKKRFLQVKIDGHHIVASYNKGKIRENTDEKILLYTRQRKKINFFENIREELYKIFKKIDKEDRKYIHFDGEFYRHKISRQKISSMLRRTVNKSEDENIIRYYIFDIIDDRNPKWIFKDRINFLKSLEIENDYIRMVNTFEVHNKDEINKYYQYYLEKGYEGIMLKDKNGIYEKGKRSPYSIKVKEIINIDCEIINFKEAEDSQKGCIIFECYYPKNDVKFWSVPKEKLEDRKIMFKNGNNFLNKKCVVTCFSFSDKGIPEMTNIVRILENNE